MELAWIVWWFCYGTSAAALFLYGLHRLGTLWVVWKNPGPDPRPQRLFSETEWPPVTVQIPIYNERAVAARIIDAVAHLDYPRDRLEIQVLDDSTDETAALASDRVDFWRERGLSIARFARKDRRGFKAGALEEGLHRATGEFVAIFDADFLPDSNFLRDTVPYFSDPAIGMVQTRWEHLNRDESPLTRAQAHFLDAHFFLEQTARHRSGKFFNFNGTAGIWRRTAIDSAGGWQHDTLTEDLDLSYRAQMAGWRFIFLRDRSVPAELPGDVDAFKSQQHRWAKGSVQTCVKLLGPLLRSRLPWRIKAEAALHLTSYFAHPALLLFCAASHPSWVAAATGGAWWFLAWQLPFFSATMLSFLIFYGASLRMQGISGWQRLMALPWILAIGTGIAVNNCFAVFEGLSSGTGSFERTPKTGASGDRRATSGTRGRAKRSWTLAGELFFLALSVHAALSAASAGQWALLPFLGFYIGGFGVLATLSATRILSQIALPRFAKASGRRHLVSSSKARSKPMLRRAR